MATEFKLAYTGNQINERLRKIDDLALKSDIPTKTSDLTNNSGFVNADYVKEYAQPKDDYALKSDIPTDYLTEIPDEYVTEDELNAKGYLTEHQNLDGYAKTEDIPDNIVTCDLEGATEDETIIPDSSSNVNPVEKTDDMTQPVGVDADGRLWVAPIGGGSGGSFNITSDDDGNVIIASAGSVEITDDGAGNVIIK